MSRTFFAVVAAAALATALPSFALDNGPEYQSASGPRVAAAGGGVALAVLEPAAQPAPLPNERFASGRVVMTTPSEVVLHTAQGMRDFAISQQTDETVVPVEGQWVTVGYVPQTGVVQVAEAQPAAATDRTATRVAEAAVPPATESPAPHAMSDTEPAESTPAVAAAPAVVPAVAREAHRRTRLPKTASDRPLVLVAGLLAVAAAGTIRLALRA